MGIGSSIYLSYGEASSKLDLSDRSKLADVFNKLQVCYAVDHYAFPHIWPCKSNTNMLMARVMVRVYDGMIKVWSEMVRGPSERGHSMLSSGESVVRVW